MSTFRVMACTASLLTTVAAATAQPAVVEFDAELDTYELNHWPDAYQAMSRLADGGHGEAARVALQMLRYGHVLYGQRFEATPYQELSWSWLQRCGADCADLLRQTAVAPSGC